MTGVPRVQTEEEEWFNTLTHGVGAALAIAALPVMICSAAYSQLSGAVVSVSIFGSTLLLLYTISALYHYVGGEHTKAVFQRFDHICIYLLIAGTYTPFTLCVIGGALGWALFGVVWGLALAGIIFKAIFGARYDSVSAILYVGMGWLVLFAIRTIVQELPASALTFLALGGAMYTLGVFFYLLDIKKKWFHAIWHCFVLAGSICHVFSVLSLLSAQTPA